MVGEIGGNDGTIHFKNYLEEAFNMLDYMGAGWTWYSNASVKRGRWSIVRKGWRKTRKLISCKTYPRAIVGDPKGLFMICILGLQLRFKTKKEANRLKFCTQKHYPNGFEVKVFHEKSQVGKKVG